MTKQTWGNILIVIGAIGAVLGLWAGNQPALFFIGLIVAGVGIFLRLRK